MSYPGILQLGPGAGAGALLALVVAVLDPPPVIHNPEAGLNTGRAHLKQYLASHHLTISTIHAHITLVETQGTAQHVAMMLPAFKATSVDEGYPGDLDL